MAKKRDLRDRIKCGHVVQDYYLDGTHIQICDDFCVKTQEEIDAILQHVGDIHLDCLAAQAEQAAQDKQGEKGGKSA
ncbi:MAG: hypothetical protein ABF904_11620 [Ethanoligenens sp.]